jgi:acetylornithine deacetylase
MSTQDWPETSRDWLARLVAFPTVSRDSNLKLIDWVEAFLRERGARCRRTWSEDRRKANLYARIGPDVAGGVVLSGHTDVVPVDGQDWHTDPFKLIEQDGRLFGRGSADMKAFSAVALACLGKLDATSLTRPLDLALSYDEEVGCLGVDRMVEDALAHFAKPAFAIIGEPTTMQIVRAHKSINVFKTTVIGQAAHSSQPHRGAGAILAAARIIERLRQIGLARRAEAGQGGFEPPWTTIQVGRIEGGTAVNILPAECRFLWEYRALPDEDTDGIIGVIEDFIATEVLPELREFAPGSEVRTEVIARVPPLQPDPEARCENWLRKLPGVRAGGPGEVSFATEAGSFQRAGISSVVCGPGSINQAHQPNEFIELSELDRCEQMIGGAIDFLTDC